MTRVMDRGYGASLQAPPMKRSERDDIENTSGSNSDDNASMARCSNVWQSGSKTVDDILLQVRPTFV